MDNTEFADHGQLSDLLEKRRLGGERLGPELPSRMHLGRGNRVWTGNMGHGARDPETAPKDPHPRVFTLWRPAQPEKSGQDAAPLHPQVLHPDFAVVEVPQRIFLALVRRLMAQPRVVGHPEPRERAYLEAQSDLDEARVPRVCGDVEIIARPMRARQGRAARATRRADRAGRGRDLDEPQRRLVLIGNVQEGQDGEQPLDEHQQHVAELRLLQLAPAFRQEKTGRQRLQGFSHGGASGGLPEPLTPRCKEGDEVASAQTATDGEEEADGGGRWNDGGGTVDGGGRCNAVGVAMSTNMII